MARGRAALTDKEEKILVQAKLMGLSTASMVKIGNRLRALEKEQEEIARINDTIQGFSWEDPVDINRLKVFTSDGMVIEAVRGKKGQSRWDRFSYSYNITVTKPGTRFKPRIFKDRSLTCDYNWTKRLMPGQSKETYSLIRWVRHSMAFEESNENT